MKENRFIVYEGKKYAFDLNKIKAFCLTSDKEMGKESEIVETYVMDETNTFHLDSKQSRDLKTSGNPQNDTIVYDLIKLFITVLLSNDLPIDMEDTDTPFIMDFATSLAFNTMIENGMIYEITD